MPRGLPVLAVPRIVSVYTFVLVREDITPVGGGLHSSAGVACGPRRSMTVVVLRLHPHHGCGGLDILPQFGIRNSS